jgi:microsomal epoxide hydrolase
MEPTDPAIVPFYVEVDDDVLDDLHRRLHHARFSAHIPDASWDYGTDPDYLTELVRYWRDEYDWRRFERRLNEFSQFETVIDGTKVHFLHVRSREPDAVPLLLTHGWPGSVAEFVELIGPLVDPGAHGADPRDAFHIVCPSIPGYGFSGPTFERGWSARRVAGAFAVLMRALGYSAYGAQGGDFGSTISVMLALQDPEHMIGLHLNRVGVLPPPDLDPDRAPEDERIGLADRKRYVDDESGYAKIQSTRPQTIGLALDDSPIGLAAWIVEKFRAWSDCDGDVERRFTKDQLLDNIMIYWVTATAHSSGRLYYETEREGPRVRDNDYVTVPTAGAMFPHEIIRIPRRWAERHFNIVRWTEMERGGHFAAMEEPELLVEDVRAFFRPLRIQDQTSTEHP